MPQRGRKHIVDQEILCCGHGKHAYSVHRVLVGAARCCVLSMLSTPSPQCVSCAPCPSRQQSPGSLQRDRPLRHRGWRQRRPSLTHARITGRQPRVAPQCAIKCPGRQGATVTERRQSSAAEAAATAHCSTRNGRRERTKRGPSPAAPEDMLGASWKGRTQRKPWPRKRGSQREDLALVALADHAAHAKVHTSWGPGRRSPREHHAHTHCRRQRGESVRGEVRAATPPDCVHAASPPSARPPQAARRAPPAHPEATRTWPASSVAPVARRGIR